MDGKPLQKSISAQSLSGTVPLLMEYLILFGLGIIAILLHLRLKTPLGLPGHHGLEFMAVLMAGRVASQIKYASSVSSLGIGFLLLFPLFGNNDPFMIFNYMLPGIIVDILYNVSYRLKWHWFVIAIISGLAYFMIPFSRLLIHILTGFPYSSFAKNGYIIPLIGFFAFGMAGGFTGAGITSSILNKIIKK